MMKWFKIAAVLALTVPAPSAWAEDCPGLADNSATMDRLFSELHSAPNEMLGRAVNDKIWSIWVMAPDAVAQNLLDLGRERIRVADYEMAIAHFTALIAYCPHYAEGWNQRGFAHFLRQDYDASLDDIAEALERDPRHYGALAGRALILIGTGRTSVGYTALRSALKLNPWLNERHLLPPGEDI